ncbi:hypothetical protein VP01_3329g3 [Puccinia sorghi]|uniref:Uncharacterized protein n=1 Tax=Puccinia sorghi TaxID=27349 RepID=A0A0L6UXA8_9BASI|nr:hypothetical protein VP01_3329g3 [Puccinia sorghi]
MAKKISKKGRIFSGTFATGELAESEMPDLMDYPLANITPSNRVAKKTSKAKRPAMILDPDDSDNDLDPTSSSAPPSKRPREGKNDAIKNSLGGLTSAIEKLTKKKQNPHEEAVQTYSEKAMDVCSKMFSNNLSDHKYISFISVLENENKARTFLTLSRTSTPKQCEIWMKKEASKLVSTCTSLFVFMLLL